MKKVLTLVAGFVLAQSAYAMPELYSPHNTETRIPIVYRSSADGSMLDLGTSDCKIAEHNDGTTPVDFVDATNEATKIGTTNINYLQLEAAETDLDYTLVWCTSNTSNAMPVILRVSHITRGPNFNDIDGALGSDNIATNAIGASELAPNAIGAEQIAENAIGASEIATNAIGYDQFVEEVVWKYNIPNNHEPSDKDAGGVLDKLTEETTTLATDVALGSVIGQIMDNGTTWSYAQNQHSLEVIASDMSNVADSVWNFDIPSNFDPNQTKAGAVLTKLTEEAATLNTDVALGSIFGQLMDDGTIWSYNQAIHSLEAARIHVGDGTNLTKAGGTGSHMTDLSVNDMKPAALNDFFSVNSGTTYASAIPGSVVKEIADNAAGTGLNAEEMRMAIGGFGATILSVVSPTEFSLDNGPTIGDSLNDEYTAIFTDTSAANMPTCHRQVRDWLASRTVVIDQQCPAGFSITAGDRVLILPNGAGAKIAEVNVVNGGVDVNLAQLADGSLTLGCLLAAVNAVESGARTATDNGGGSWTYTYRNPGDTQDRVVAQFNNNTGVRNQATITCP